MKPLSLIVALLLIALTQPANAGSPTLTNLLPAAGQRGTEVEVHFYGDRLRDFEGVLFHTPGINATQFAVIDQRRVRAVFEIPKDAPLGEYQVRVTTRSGITEMVSFHVVDKPLTFEPAEEERREQSTSFDKPLPVAMGGIVYGRTQSEDVDYYSVELKKGQRLSAEVTGMRIGRGFTDPQLTVFDVHRNKIAVSDDTDLLRQDPYVSFLAPREGKYILAIRDSGYAGGENNWYMIHVGAFVRPAAVFPLGGKPGQKLAVRFIGDAAGDFTETLTLPKQPDNGYGIKPTQHGEQPPTGNAFRVNNLTNVLEDPAVENGTMQSVESAPSHGAPVAFNGIVDKPGDMDYFKLSLKKGERVNLRCFAASMGSPLDPVVNVYSVKDKKHILGNDDQGGLDSTVVFTAPAEGEYFVRIRDHRNRGSKLFVYRLEVTKPAPWMSTAIQRYDQQRPQSRQAVAIPSGNRVAALVRVRQNGVTGRIAPSITGLPTGVTVTGYGDVGQGVMPVVFEAPANRPFAVSLADIGVLGKTGGKSPQEIRGGFSQITPIVTGNPNRTEYCFTTLKTMPVAVTAPVPFKLEVIQPKAPLVRDGKTLLKLKLERKDDFQGRVRMYMLWRPPGVGATGEVRLEKANTEGHYYIDANGNAPTRTWPMVVVAMGELPSGPVWTSSQLFEVTVEEPYVTATIEKASCKQGDTIDLVVNLDHPREWKGEGELKLLGLPAGCEVQPQKIKPGQKQAKFRVKVAENTPRGVHRSLMCELSITVNGEPAVHRMARGSQLRVDIPKKKKNAQTRLEAGE